MRKEDITIATFLWGDWGYPFGAKYVANLRNSILRNSTTPHRFVLITDKSPVLFNGIKDIEIVRLPSDVAMWRGNLKKIFIHSPEAKMSGQVFLFDLDTVVMGNIDRMLGTTESFCTCECCYHPKQIGGSLFSFPAGAWTEMMWMPFERDVKHLFEMEAKTVGFERRFYRMKAQQEGLKVSYWQRIMPGQVLSYKVDIRDKNLTKPPSGTAVVRFHGPPRPHEVVLVDKWVGENWR